MKKTLTIAILLVTFYSCKEAAEIEEVPIDDNIGTVINSNAPLSILDLLPSGTLPNSTGTVILQVKTNQEASCKYSENNVSVYGMSETFSSNDGLTHTKELSIDEVKDYTYYVGCLNQKGAIAQGLNKIIFEIDTNTVDLIAPNLYNAGPTNELSEGTTQINIYANTNENATCRYSDNINHTFEQMNALTTTGGTTHTKNIANLVEGINYTFYFLCEDMSGNQSNKRGISFAVNEFILQDGLTLYTNNCALCHGDIPFSEKQGATASRIRNGINGVGSMRALEVLKDSEINNIVDALAD